MMIPAAPAVILSLYGTENTIWRIIAIFFKPRNDFTCLTFPVCSPRPAMTDSAAMIHGQSAKTIIRAIFSFDHGCMLCLPLKIVYA